MRGDASGNIPRTDIGPIGDAEVVCWGDIAEKIGCKFS